MLLTELKVDLNAYLASTDPKQVPTRTLAEVIAFNAAEPRETVLFGQELFEQAEATGGLDDPAYVEARATSLRLAGVEGIDKMMADNRVVALVAPTTSRAWTNDREDDDDGQGSASTLAAVAGYPHLTVPMGMDRGMPVGISFIGRQVAGRDGPVAGLRLRAEDDGARGTDGTLIVSDMSATGPRNR